ncbi:MAG: RNase adapter RapZ [Candidatus Aminicenantes bacterium]|nr:RNase adapter RapZ [Candidatus Aminicenantes bacterium]
MKDNRFLIITGLSGSGKTCVSRFLEDLGYYCIDNLPAKLIPTFVDLWMREEFKIAKVALVVDIREEGFRTEFPKVLESIRKKISPHMIFLDASDEALVKRFSESRRPHPIAVGKSMIESLSLERESLAGIKSLADEVIDTTELSIHDLKKILNRRYQKGNVRRMQIVITSFGYKFGIPVDSDLVFDTRFLPNPFYVDALRGKTGRTKSVKEFVLQTEEGEKFLREFFCFIDYLMPCFIEEGKSILTISIGCTGGKHRSVALGEALKRHLKSMNLNVRLIHRDIYK